ncbi:MAG: WXG100 family type VII secretion target [Mycobacteriales bacterium]
MSTEIGRRPPESLPDVLQGLPRPAGHPHTLFAMSADFSHAAAELERIRTDLFALLLQVHGPWEGDALEAFHGLMSTVPGRYHFTAEGYRKAAAALKDYAGSLEQAQRAWEAAERIGRTDAGRQAALRALDPAYQWDLFSADRVRARGMVEAALQRLHSSTLRTGGVLRSLESTLPGRAPVKPDIFRGRGTSFLQGLDEVRDLGMADLRDIWQMHELVVPWQAPSAWRDTVDSYYDDAAGACSDPSDYMRDSIYDYVDGEEFQAGNDARGLAGLAYNVAGGPRGLILDAFKAGRWQRRHGRGPRDRTEPDKGTEPKRDVCHPLG